MLKCSVILVGLALALFAAAPATATFPGRNGEIVLMEGSGSKQGEQRSWLLRFPPSPGESLSRQVCSRRAEPPVCTHLDRPAFTPDGSRFAAVADEAQSCSPAWALWLLTPDGRRLESHPLASHYSDLNWAPDASAFVASRVPSGGFLLPSSERPSMVVVLNRDGSERDVLATDAFDPDWCADGSVILVQYGELRVVRPGGSLRRLTWRGGSEPSCSPNSRRVAFTRKGALWTVPLAGGHARKLTKGDRPAWSPDGRQIAYLRDRFHAQAETTYTELYRIGLRRHRVRLVSNAWAATDDPYSDAFAYGPVWRPLPRR